MRVVICIVFLVLASFCGYGLLASFEPGAGLMWKVGYAVGTAAFLIMAGLSLRRPAHARPK